MLTLEVKRPDYFDVDAVLHLTAKKMNYVKNTKKK